MASAEIENYRQLQQEYERKSAEYKHAEQAYTEAEANKSAEAVKLYDDLTDRRRELDDIYDRLRNARIDLAELRETASRKLAY